MEEEEIVGCLEIESEASSAKTVLSNSQSNSRLSQFLSQSPQLYPNVFNSPTEENNNKMTGLNENGQVDATSIHRNLIQSHSLDINESITLDLKNESKVLVLYTGGTIGMVRNKEGALAPEPHAMERKIRALITMHDEEYAYQRFQGVIDKFKYKEDVLLPLVLPHVPNHKRVIYTIYEYDPLLDSSNMTMDDWIQIASDIQHSYTLFDGFVILHGTDTLAYTSSALSFMLENLGKPVIVTGSQIPCFETRSDGRDNFVGALILAGNYNIPEVSVYFRHQLIRGNRTVKISSGDLDAFASPNMSPLVKVGIDIEVDYKSIHRPKTIEKFRVHNTLNRNVVLLRLFPSIRSDTVAHFLENPIQGVVFQCYGAGNVPNNRTDIMKCIREAADRGVLIVSVTQCTHGGVSGLYETGKALLDAGVIPGADLTPEAALAKLSYVLSKDWSNEKRREMMMTNIAGEITVLKKKKQVKEELKDDKEEMEIIRTIARALHLKTSDELNDVEEILFPSILCSATFKGDLKTLEQMKALGADMAMTDYDMRSPLHVAASEGNIGIVEYLLKNGASVHIRDRSEDSPLKCAIDNNHPEVIKILITCGAHLQISHKDLGEMLTYLARKGDLDKLKCYYLAGVNMNTTNLSLNTPLHMAVETGQEKVVNFLIGIGVKLNERNLYGQTPKAIATVLRRTDILNSLRSADGEETI